MWTFEAGGFRVERRLVLPYAQNTAHVTYRLLEGEGTVELDLRPGVHIRPHDAPVGAELPRYTLSASEGRYEISAGPDLPPLRLEVVGRPAAFTLEPVRLAEMVYRAERSRGYDAQGDLWSPGSFRVELTHGSPVTFVSSPGWTRRWTAGS